MNKEDLILIDFFKPEGKNDEIALYFGSDENYTGDKWDITPFEDIAGMVYYKYIKHKTHHLLKDFVAYQPINDWSKNDLKNRLTPCLLLIPKQTLIDVFGFDIDKTPMEERPWPMYDRAVGYEPIVKIYYGDTYKKIYEQMKKYDVK